MSPPGDVQTALELSVAVALNEILLFVSAADVISRGVDINGEAWPEAISGLDKPGRTISVGAVLRRGIGNGACTLRSDPAELPPHLN